METILTGIKIILPYIDRTKIRPPSAIIISTKDYKSKGRKTK